MDEMFGVICGFHNTKQRLTVVFDKGMNAEKNFAWIDDHNRIHFITNYSTYFSEDLVQVPLERFEVVSTDKNRDLLNNDQADDCLLSYRTRGDYWGKERTVIVTYNPASARKQCYTFDNKLDVLRKELLVMRKKIREDDPHWRDQKKVYERYFRLCERLHISSDFYSLKISKRKNTISMAFTRNMYLVEKKRQSFGKNIIITDNTDWSTEQIITANLDRWEVEDRFRLSKNNDLVAVNPLRHWTDSKIRCHLFSCVISLTYLRRIELRLLRAGAKRTAVEVMEDMNNLHSVLFLSDGRSKPKRKLEEPSKTQSEVLTAFGYKIDGSGVLHSVTG
jgi:transposase